MEQIASQFMRAVRGKRSQVQFARRLGYAGNPITDWERAQRFPTAEEALRALTLSGVDVTAATRRFSPNVPLRGGGAGIPAWLEGLRGSAPLGELAARSGHSRFAVSRWLSGKAKPRL